MSAPKQRQDDSIQKPREGELPGTPPVAPDEIEQLKAQAAENWDKYLRAVAELENYRKRVAREKDELVRYTSERVVASLLPVLDNFERALAAAEQHTESTAAMLDGLKQIDAQFRKTLEDFGMMEVVAQAGHAFDPNLHEAISHVPSDEHPEGHVLQQVQRGYKLFERLLRPARVVVSKGTPPTEIPKPE